MAKPAKTVQQIHFEDLDGFQFERLVFAYHARTEKWISIEWYGQVGSDLGRDIWGQRDDDTPTGESVCIQCANRKRLTKNKATRDIDKAVKASKGTPQRFRIVTASKVSAKMRDDINAHATSKGISICEIWSGSEFEEFLRKDAESLLKRMFDGETFPDAVDELKLLAQTSKPLTDDETLALMARLFDRPAFYTPLHQESNLPAFKQALTDTIQALGTGIWKTRDGDVIARIPSRQALTDAGLRRKVQTVETALAKLRARFDQLVQRADITGCGCKDPNCPVFMMTPVAVTDLTALRDEVLRLFQDAYPAFVMPQPW